MTAPAPGTTAGIITSWTRPARTCEDATRHSQLAKRCLEAMSRALYPTPVRIAPKLLGTSKKNRLFSVKHVHAGVLDSIVRDGHDPGRAQIGVCVELQDKQDLADLVAHNKTQSASSPLMPPVDEDMRYEILGSTHYNAALRCGEAGMQSPAGDLGLIKAKDKSFADACTHGHAWIVLPSEIAESLKEDICTWRNQDQNENQTLTDGEIIRQANLVVEQLVKATGGTAFSLPLPKVVNAMAQKTTLRINPSVLGGFARWVCQMAEEKQMNLVHQFLATWSTDVNSKELSIPHTFFENTSKIENLKGKALLRMYLALAMYTIEGSQAKTRPAPDVCGFITPGDLTTLGRQEFLAQLGDKTLQRIQNEYLPKLQGDHPKLPHHLAMDEVNQISNLVVRAILGKNIKTDWGNCPISTGKMTEAKADALLGFWAKHLDTRYPKVCFGAETGLDKFYPTEAGDLGDTFMVPENPGLKFQVGGFVRLAKRVTLYYGNKTEDERKDVLAATDVRILGVDLEKKKAPGRIRGPAKR